MAEAQRHQRARLRANAAGAGPRVREPRAAVVGGGRELERGAAVRGAWVREGPVGGGRGICGVCGGRELACCVGVGKVARVDAGGGGVGGGGEGAWEAEEVVGAEWGGGAGGGGVDGGGSGCCRTRGRDEWVVGEAV